jgi:hypothetical protein
MSGIDHIFDPSFTATDLFTNRDTELAAFEASLMTHLQRVVDGEAVLATAQRRNVLTYYGIGGIGKTELSKRLERWVRGELPDSCEWGPAPAFDQPVRTVRFDFHGSTAVSAIDIVLGLRGAVAAPGLRFPAFDIGLAAWWAQARPGTALPDMRAGGFDVREQIVDTVADVLGDAGLGFGVGPLTVRTGVALVDAVRNRRLRGRTLHDCAQLAAVVEAATTDASPYVAATLAGLLSWDLEQLLPGERHLIVAFADAVEYIQGGDRASEKLFNRIVHLTPSVLWVVTSKESLDWTEPALAGALTATGSRWPGLRLDATEDPRQHRVGDLSDADVLRFLHAASGAGGNPVLTDEIIDRVRAGSHGLPLYLDLSLSIARNMAGGPLTPAAFGGSLPDLVTRVFANLPHEERLMARTAALVPRFAPDLIAEAAGGLMGDAERFCGRALVTRDDHPLFPYRLHDAVRSALMAEPLGSPGAWAPADRTAYASRLVDALERRHDERLDEVANRLDILEIVWGLCAAHGLRPEWLFQKLIDLPGMDRTARRVPRPAEDTWLWHIHSFFEAWRGRTTLPRVEYLERFVAEEPPGGIRDAAQRYLAYNVRSTGAPGATERALEILHAQLLRLPDDAVLRYQVARTMIDLGRHATLLEHLRDYPLDETSDLRIRSDIAYNLGQVEQSLAGPEVRSAYLRARGRHRVALENEAYGLLRKALIGRASVADCDTTIERADRYGMQLSLRLGLTSKVLCLRDDPDTASALLDEGVAVAAANGSGPAWRELTASLVYGLRFGDSAVVESAYAAWVAKPRVWGYSRQLVELLLRFAGYPATLTWPEELGDADVIHARWQEVIVALVK